MPHRGRSRREQVLEEKGDLRNHSLSGEFRRTLGVSEATWKRLRKNGTIPDPVAYTTSGWGLWSPEQVTEAIRKRVRY